MTRVQDQGLETVGVATLLGLAFHDLLTDTRVVEGLLVTASPVGGGRTSRAFRTRSGAYAFRALDGMRPVEFTTGDELGSLVPAREFHVAVVDTRARFLPLVLTVAVPTVGLVTLALPGAGSLPPEEHPIYMFSAPTRALPGSFATVRAQLADHADGTPAAFARVEVVTDPDTPARRRHVGVAGEDGAVLLPVPYPRFGSAPDGVGSVPAAGTRGDPPAARRWPLRVRVHHQPDLLTRPPGAPAPLLPGILAQPPGRIWEVRDGAPAAALDASLRYGAELVLRTAGDPRSRLLVGTPAP
ncbi:hypothetical protein ACI79J_12785 [Geodermatophilus sp. SYSU D01062]